MIPFIKRVFTSVLFTLLNQFQKPLSHSDTIRCAFKTETFVSDWQNSALPTVEVSAVNLGMELVLYPSNFIDTPDNQEGGPKPFPEVSTTYGFLVQTSLQVFLIHLNATQHHLL